LEDNTYSADVSDLVKLNRVKIIEASFVNALFYFIILLLMYYFIGIFSVIAFSLLLFLFLPSPLIIAPEQYKIDNHILYYNEKKIIVKNLKLIVNEEENYVSLRRWFWFIEIVRLYSRDIKILEKTLSVPT
jgi:uncharacterized membrane protein